MTPSCTVVVFDPRSSFFGAVKSDLALGGFDVVAVPGWKDVLAAARGRRPAAMVLPPQVPWSLWRGLRRDESLRGVRLVVATPGKSRVPRAMPVFPLVRADAYVSEADVKTPGAVSDAVYASVARGPLAPPARRERLGESIWYAGIAVVLVAALLFVFGVFGGPRGRSLLPPGSFKLFLLVYGAGVVLMDLGSRLARSLRPGLRWDSWIWLALIAVALSLTALGWTGWMSA